MIDIYKLQNGTDIRGVAFKDENSELDITLTEDLVKSITLGFATWLKNNNNDNITIALGRDSRITGENFLKIASEILISNGFNVINCDLATTPSMFMTTIMEEYNADGAVMFTASHMPYVYNGMKMFTSSGCLEKHMIKEILDLVSIENYSKIDRDSSIVCKNLLEDYSRIIVDRIRKGVNSSKNYDKPLEGMKIIVDAGNGSGGFFEDRVLKVLGADTNGSQFTDPDGMFPNHIPNPENKEAMESISKAVINEKADLGIIFDTDVDRAALVDQYGNPINKNALIALISKIILDEQPNSTIVTDSVTSKGLNKFITNLGGVHHRFKRGYKNVINEAIKLNEEGTLAPLAIETSGHAALKENYFLDDGSYLIAKILIEVAKLNEEGKIISDCIKDFEYPVEDIEVRIKINKDDFKEYADEIINELGIFVELNHNWEKEKVNHEGIRVNCNSFDEKAWFLVRVSLHEPLLVLNIESDVKGGCKRVLDSLEIFLSRYDLDF